MVIKLKKYRKNINIFSRYNYRGNFRLDSPVSDL